MATRRSAHTLNPRKKPRQKRSEATVAAVLEAAARILETEGFEGYTTNSVARRAGISIGSLYQYFPSKDAITKALIVRETSTLLTEVSAIEVGRHGRRGLQQLIEVAVAYQFRRPVLARLLDMEERRLPISEEIQRVGAQLARTVQRCLDAPDMAAAPRSRFVEEDLLAIVKALVDAAGDRRERELTTLVARVNRAVFGYLEHVSE
jgi:AcrR family transcriptional regulator